MQDVHIHNENINGEEWPTYCDAFYSNTTPALQQLSCNSLSFDIWKEVNQVFGRRLCQDIALRSNKWLTHHHKLSRELPQACVFNGLANDPISRILVSSSPLNSRSDRPIPPFEHANSIKHLGMPASHKAWRALYESNEPAQELCDILSTMPNLTCLWVVPEDPDWGGSSSYSGYAGRAKESHVIVAARICPLLNFVRIANYAWRVRHVEGSGRTRQGIELEILDDWEDAAECPAIFYCPEPLSWSSYVHHADF